MPVYVMIGSANRETGILDRMMLVDVQVADRFHGEIDQRMPAQLLEHVIEETDPRGHVIRARPVQVDGDEDAGFARLAADRRGAHAAPIAPICAYAILTRPAHRLPKAHERAIARQPDSL